jgi:hypothetical protein
MIKLNQAEIANISAGIMYPVAMVGFLGAFYAYRYFTETDHIDKTHCYGYTGHKIYTTACPNPKTWKNTLDLYVLSGGGGIMSALAVLQFIDYFREHHIRKQDLLPV